MQSRCWKNLALGQPWWWRAVCCENGIKNMLNGERCKCAGTACKRKGILWECRSLQVLFRSIACWEWTFWQVWDWHQRRSRLMRIPLSFDIAGSQAVKVCALFQDYEGHPFFDFEEQTLKFISVCRCESCARFPVEKGPKWNPSQLPWHVELGARCHRCTLPYVLVLWNFLGGLARVESYMILASSILIRVPYSGTLEHKEA